MPVSKSPIHKGSITAIQPETSAKIGTTFTAVKVLPSVFQLCFVTLFVAQGTHPEPLLNAEYLKSTHQLQMGRFCGHFCRIETFKLSNTWMLQLKH